MSGTRQFFLVESPPGRAYTTYRDRDGQQQRVTIARARIGPFPSLGMAADWMSTNAVPHTSYEIETLVSPDY